MCGYCGHEFGASYPDSVCIDGWLWDADSDDGDGFTSGGDRACPRCNTETMLRALREDVLDGSTGADMAGPYCPMVLWEDGCAKAAKENPEVASRVLDGLGVLEIEDWPDRDAVYRGAAPWSRTVTKRWSFVSRSTSRSDSAIVPVP